jgi:hypothetical protein
VEFGSEDPTAAILERISRRLISKELHNAYQATALHSTDPKYFKSLTGFILSVETRDSMGDAKQQRFSREYLGDQLVNNYTTHIKLQHYTLHQCHLNNMRTAISTSKARRSQHFTKSRVSTNTYIHPCALHSS